VKIVRLRRKNLGHNDVLEFTHVVAENMLNVTPDFEYADIQ